MMPYLRWSIWQLYLLVFWPTQFARETEGFKPRHRFLYLLKMFPWIVCLAVLGNLLGGLTCQRFKVEFDWIGSWVGMSLFIPMYVMACVIARDVGWGVVNAVVWGVTGGVICGVAFGMPGGWELPAAEILGVSGSLMLGLAAGVAVGVVTGVEHGERSASGKLGPRVVGLPLAIGAFGVVSGLIGIVSSGPDNQMAVFAIMMAIGITGPVTYWLIYFRIPTYPVDAVLAAAAYFSATSRPRAAVRSWRWHPIVWNEVIWLPLPYTEKLLVLLVQQDRVEGLRQIAFVAAKRTPQRGAARSALVEVALADLEGQTVADLAEVAEKLQWTADAPSELPAELFVALPRFDRVAQHLGQYLTLQGAYRRKEALQAALSELEALRNSLIFVRGRVAPSLLGVANAWERLVAAKRDAFLAQEVAARDIPNPFVFGNPVTERDANVFTGRHDIVRQIEQSILNTRQAPTLLLHGPRRMGKTSILFQLPHLLGPDFAPVSVDCQNPAVTSSEVTLLSYLSRNLSAGLQRRRITVEPLSRDGLASEPFRVFDEWLDRVERSMPDSMRALLCLDEYEHLEVTLKAGWGEQFLNALRHTLQHRPKVVLMFTGSHTFEEQGPAWTNRFLSVRRIRVSFLTRQEVIPLLTKPIPEFDMTYAPGALELLLDATAGQPFITQAVAFELVQFLNEHHRKEAAPAEVEMAIVLALESASVYFANVWNDAGTEGQAVLSALVRGDAPPDRPRARKWLRDHDVLTDAGTFAVPLVERWVRQKLAGEFENTERGNERPLV